ncbi:MAG: NADH-quinone oxidoreductase subunit NuoH [Candidatus Omnitrophica bacterium]|nr:NADH-quinone oxidoreductase subunit NuoH [Candidatus Omnitrophota bacterium]
MEFAENIFVSLKQGILKVLANFLPDWMVVLAAILISITAIAIFGPVTMMYLTWLERKVVGRIQNRFGPNRVGIFGLLQPIADGIKMLTKEDIVPESADRVTHFLAPVIVVMPALLVFSVLPFGRGMTAVNLNVGLLFFLAVSTLSTFAIFMGSWGSRNKFSVLGGMRAVAQMVSYEVPMVLSVVPVILAAGTLSTVEIVEAQAGGKWFLFTPWGFFACLIFFLCGVAEVNRTPFDIAEGESEIIAGFHTEYSGMKFALFYMAEFMGAFAVSGLTVTLFLGGWQGPWLPSWLWFLLKTYLFVLVMIWFRGTFPRLRVDQLMGFAWKVLLPFALLNVFVAALWTLLPAPKNHLVALAAEIAAVFLIWFFSRKDAPQKRTYTYAT